METLKSAAQGSVTETPLSSRIPLISHSSWAVFVVSLVMGASRVIHLLKVTAFNLPRLTRLVGVVVALLVGVVHVGVAVHSVAPRYVNGLLIAAAVGALLAATALVVGFRRVGWGLAVTVSGLCCVAYLISRTLGFPGFSAAVGAWHDPVGTLSLLLEVLLLAVYVSLRLGYTVDIPGQRDWDTYFSGPAAAQGEG